MSKVPLLSRVKDIFKGGSSAKRKKIYHNVLLDNPEEKWETVGELGDGAYGKVYKAQNKHNDQLAALKLVILEGDDDLESFMIEIDILAEFRHPNIVELLEAYYFDGKLWMYLEYCDGGAVDSIMVDLDRGLTEKQVAYLCKNLCQALSYIHSHKVIHRDLKAGNVLLTMEGGVKLADFGVSAKNKNTWDKRGTFIGTPYWLAPEVILCETFIDAKYDYKADIWSLGISLIEFAQMDPPNHEISPVRVMLKIQKSDPPKLDYPHKWSKEFNDFIAKCLVKDPVLRPDAEELLKHPFLKKGRDLKPIRDLLLEYKAEVVEEEVDDDSEHKGRRKKKSLYQRVESPESTRSLVSLAEEQDHSRSTVCNSTMFDNSDSQDDRESVISIDKENGHLTNEGDKLHRVCPTIEEYKEVTSTNNVNEKRVSKGPAPPPPVISNSQPSPKKGPAPAVPSSGSPTNVRSSADVTPSSSISTSSIVTSLAENEIPSCTMSSTISPTINGADKSPTESPTIDPNSAINSEVLMEQTSELDESNVENKVSENLKSQDNQIVTISDMTDKLHSSTTTSEPNEIVSLETEKITVNHVEVTEPVELDPIVEGLPKNVEINLGSCENEDTKPISTSMEITIPSVSSDASFNIITSDNSFNIDISSIPVPVTFNVLSPERSGETVSPSTPMSPEPLDVLLASITSEGTVIVRTPTPTPTDISHQILKRENVVTYTVAEESEILPKSVIEPNLPSLTEQFDSSENYSLAEAEAQAVHILETAIDSAMDVSFKYSDEASGHSSPSSLNENSMNFEAKGSVVVVESDDVVADEEFAHKLDESEVLVSNFSILQEETIAPDNHSSFEFNLEDEDPETSISKGDETHISVIAIEEANKLSHPPQTDEQNQISALESKLMSLTIEGTTIEDTDVDDMDNTSTISTSNECSNVKVSSTETDQGVDVADKVPHDLEEAKNAKNEAIEPAPLKLIQNGVKRHNSRSSEISDTDTTSTIGSDKENRHRQDDSDIGEDVMLRNPQKKPQTSVINDRNAAAKNLKNKELQESIALRKKTRKRTRKFVIDGVVFTTTTSKVIYGDDEESGTLSSAHLARKQELRELKIIQRQEQKQFQELGVKANLAKQEQERKFEIEKANLIRNYDSQIENLTRQQKQLVEKAEGRQEYELKGESKKVRIEQERELKAFRESLKQEWKLLKQESELLPKDRRKETFKIRKEQLERSQAAKEKAFVERLNDTHELTLKKLSEKHRRHIALKERQFLEEKHQLLRARESALWDMEERQIQDKHQLAKEQLKDIYFLQRYQMAIRHNVEQEQVKRLNNQKEEGLLKRQQSERRQLPKRIRQEMKTREKMFREQIRISMPVLPSHEEEKDQLKKFQEQEKVKYDKERKRAELKHKKQMEELQASTESSIRELIHLQNEKGKLLTEHETYKLKSLDEEYQKELKEWKANLAPRKQKLEEGFDRQLTEQEKFYGEYLDRGLGLTATPSESSSSLARSNHS